MHPPEYDLDVQARLPPALAAIHNFIRTHDPDDIADYRDVENDPEPGARSNRRGVLGQLAGQLPRAAEKAQANAKRDAIAEAIWLQYRGELKRRDAM